MREIKFRAWNIVTKTMIDLKKITPLALNMDTDGLFIPFSDGLPLMQYTGLKDKNGKEIYEGDILEYPHREVKDDNTITFKGGAFMLTYHDGSRFYPYDNEIIGNIYENPELMSSKTESISK